MQWQLKALVAAVSFGLSAMASAQPAPLSSTTDVKPSDVGAAGRIVTPSNRTRTASDCNAPPGGVLTRCIQQHQSGSRAMADNGASSGRGPTGGHGAGGGAGRPAGSGARAAGGPGARGSG